MCQRTSATTTTADCSRTTHVVVAGAGPAGLLAAINILRRNNDGVGNLMKYKVTLVDANCDYGALDATQLKAYRSWMIGLSTHGLTAIKEIPGLFEDYVSQVGVPLDSTSIYFGKKEIKFNAKEFGDGYIVDRNYVVAALARYLNDHFNNGKSLKTIYNTKLLYVDGEKKRLLVRGSQGDREEDEMYLNYDLLIGCDGIRSVVRDAILHNHRDFECSVSDIFAKFKAVHIDCPKSISTKSVHTFPNGIPNMNGIALPETGGKLNMSFGYNLNRPPAEEMSSEDPKVIAKYLKENFKAFALDDYDDFAKQWVDQKWNTTGQVHCNFYHSAELGILLLGDAAHATSPAIGQGMNTALADASVLGKLLADHFDDLSVLLPEFSKERVKEGNALTDLSFHAYSLSLSQLIWMQFVGAIRGILHKKVPLLVDENPLAKIGRGEKLSVAYDAMCKQGTMQAVRAVNDRVRREYFEQQTGMVSYGKRNKTQSIILAVPVCLLAIAVSVACLKK